MRMMRRSVFFESIMCPGCRFVLTSSFWSRARRLVTLSNVRKCHKAWVKSEKCHRGLHFPEKRQHGRSPLKKHHQGANPIKKQAGGHANYE